MSNYNIQPLQSYEIPLLVQWVVEVPLWQRYGLQAGQLQQQFQAALGSDDLLFVLRFTDDPIPRGFIWCMKRGAFGRSPYIRLVGVHPEFNGMGLGAILLTHIEHICRSFSHEIFLLVSDFNHNAQRFYLRQGYQKVGEIPAYVLDDVTEIILHKKL